MAVPGHDERDFAFAKKFDLEIRPVVKNNFTQDILHDNSEYIANWNAQYKIHGVLVNSGKYDDMKSQEALTVLTQFAEDNDFGHKKVNYKLRDWLFSRQRYWGEPIPLIHLERDEVRSLPRVQSLEDEKEPGKAYVLKQEADESSDQRTLCSK